MSFQTSANSNALVLGSCRVSIPSSSGEYVNLGAARGVTITESWEPHEVEIDNAPTLIIGAKKQVVEVALNMLELNFQKLARMRNGFDSFSTTTFTFDSGGNVTITPQALYLTHTAATSSETVVATIYYASPTEGLTIPFPSDNETEVAEMSVTFKGTPQSSRSQGAQLYSIVDLRNNVYDSTSFPFISTAP